MKFGIQPGEFTLLSRDKQESFELSGKGKKSLHIAKQEICDYIRKILPGDDLGKIAHNLHMNTGIIIFVSNFVGNKKELKKVVRRYGFLREISENEISEFYKLTETEFENFSIDDMNELEEKWQAKKKIEHERITSQEKLKGDLLMMEHKKVMGSIVSQLGLSNQEVFLKSTLGDIIPIKVLLEYLQGENITKIESETKHNFLIWYAEKEGSATHPDALMSYEMLIIR